MRKGFIEKISSDEVVHLDSSAFHELGGDSAFERDRLASLRISE
jgi:hypothetical protein